MEPLISVIVPVYNTEKYLGECIDSILSQNFKNYELILVDDGSTDDSGNICDSFAEKYDFVSVIHKENRGVIHTRKTGFLHSKGEYISFVDSDDTIEQGMYEYMSSKALEYNADAVLCAMTLCTGKKKILLENYMEKGFYNKEMLEKSFYHQMLEIGENKNPRLIPSLCNKIIRRDIIGKVLQSLDDRVVFGEDTLCSLLCLLDSESIYLSRKSFYNYRKVETSVTHSFDTLLLQKFILLIESLKKGYAMRNFDGNAEINKYAAKFSLECIRKELLFDKENSLGKRIETVREYISNPHIADAFDFTYKNGFSNINDLKIRLIKHNQFILLYLFFRVKNIILSIRGE